MKPAGGPQGARTPEPDAADGSRSGHHPHLHRLDPRSALGELSPDNLDVKNAARILERDHYGLKKAKERILEYIAVRSLETQKGTPADPVLRRPARRRQDLAWTFDCRSAGSQVRARLPGRRTRRGRDPRPPPHLHRRAARPHPPDHEAGRDGQSALHAGRDRQAGSDFRGDPSSALLEVLDPEQNYAFSDHYLELDFDLSKVMFITTANTLSTIPPRCWIAWK